MPRLQRRRSACPAPHLEPFETRLLLSASITSALAFGSASTIGDGVASVVKDSQGNTYAFGNFGGSFDADPGAGITTLSSNGAEDLFLVAYSSSGALLWAKSFGGDGHDYASAMTLDAGGHLVLTARFQNTLDADPNAGTLTLASNGGYDVLLASFTTFGALTWARSIGGVGNDFAGKVATDASNNLYFQGMFAGTVDFGGTSLTAINTNADNFVAKFTAGGTLAWVNQHTYDNDMTISGIALDGAGNLYTSGGLRGSADLDGQSGTSTLSSATQIAWVARYDAAGALAWVKSYGEPQSSAFDTILPDDLTTDAAGNLIIAGTFGGTVDFDPGAGLHTLTEFTSPDDYTAYLLKLDSSGNYLWSGELLGSDWSHAFAVRTDASNNIYVGGYFNGTTDFDMGAGTYNQVGVAAGNLSVNTAFVAKYTAAGGLLWVQRPTGGGGLSRVFALAVGTNGQLAAGGEFYTSVAFSTTTGTQAFVSQNFNDAFVLLLAQSPTSTTLALTPSTPSGVSGRPYAITAALAAAGPGTPTGTVSFYRDGTLVDVVSLVNGQATLSPISSGAGTYAYTAVYSGDAEFSTATSGSLPFTVGPNHFPTGYIDAVTTSFISGWAADPDNPATAATLYVHIDDARVLTITAGNTRNDLLGVIGGVNHGFTFQLPPLSAGTHTVKFFMVDPEVPDPIAGGFFQVGRTLTVTSNSLYFDEAWYRTAYPDIAAAIAAGTVSSGWAHFQAYGQQEGRNPSAYFNELWYRGTYPDVATAIANHAIVSGFAHFTAYGSAEGRDPSAFFSESYYRRANPDVAAAITAHTLTSGFQHFLLAGLSEGRDGVPWFSRASYVARYADIAAALTSGTVRTAYDHFLASGLAEKRRPADWYLESFYLAQYPAVANAVASHLLPSGIDHFIHYGLQEGRTSDPTFDAAWYLAQYGDAVNALSNGTVKSAFQHYLLYGRLLGHAAHA